jgi:hypothetical protein
VRDSRVSSGRKRLESGNAVYVTWVRESGPLARAFRAARASAQPVARSVRPPTDNQRHERHGRRVRAIDLGAVDPPPTIGLPQLPERRHRSGLVARLSARRIIVWVGATAHHSSAPEGNVDVKDVGVSSADKCSTFKCTVSNSACRSERKPRERGNARDDPGGPRASQLAPRARERQLKLLAAIYVAMSRKDHLGRL